jgi:hypothetical protein
VLADTPGGAKAGITTNCAACGAKFSEFEGPESQHDGYATRDDYPKGAGYEWVCPTCFEGLKDDMRWSAVSE